MQGMTVEPFTACVLVANVDHVSSLRGIHEEPMLLAWEGNSVGSQRQEKPPCKGQILNDGRSCAAKQLLSKIQKRS